ncbi:MAG: hypothetical protein AAF460_06180 [Pseudomonadota bacterium]
MRLVDRIVRVIAEAAASAEIAFDPANLEDDLAQRTAWTPLKGGGTNMHTHVLRSHSAWHVSFEPRRWALAFPSVFIVVGVGAAVAMGSQAAAEGPLAVAFGLLFGVVFVGAGVLILRGMLQPRHFDRTLGYYWKGRARQDGHGIEALNEHCRLDEIHAVQLIRERCSGKNRAYFSYELNLVKHDGSRLNVVDHGKVVALRSDAAQLATLLDVPLWDATQPTAASRLVA